MRCDNDNEFDNKEIIKSWCSCAAKGASSWVSKIMRNM